MGTSATTGGQTLYDIHTDCKRPSAPRLGQGKRPGSTKKTAVCNFGSDMETHGRATGGAACRLARWVMGKCFD
jgi:hypothetical protein